MDSNEQLVEKYLREWFMEQDSLLIPDLGRLQANYQGASIQSTVNKLSPPNKTFRLNTGDKENDGVFAQYIALQENISEEEASKVIKQYITSLKIELGIQKKFKIANFGTFIYTPDGNIKFDVIEDYNYSGDSFGLPQIYAKPANVGAGQKQTISQNIEFKNDDSLNQTKVDAKFTSNDNIHNEEEELILEEDDIRGSGPRRILWYGAVVLCILLLIFAFLLMSDYDIFGGRDKTETDNNLTENNIIDSNEESSNTSETDNTNTEEDNNNIPETTNDDNSDASNTETAVEEESISNNTSTNTSSIVSSFKYNPTKPSNISKVLVQGSSSQFFAILGSFDNAQNAYSFYNNLNSRSIRNIKIITPNANTNKYRIALAGVSSKREAKRKGSDFTSQYGIDFWVLKY